MSARDPGTRPRRLGGWRALALVVAAGVVAGSLLVLAQPGQEPAPPVTPSGAPSPIVSPPTAAPSASAAPTPSVLTTPFTAGGFRWQPLLPRTGNLSTPLITPLVVGERVAAVLPAGTGYVAVGTRQNADASAAQADAWYSSDGTRFLHATITGGTNATMDLLLAAPDGSFVALGEDGYSDNTQMITTRGTALWTSSDGRAWRRAPAQASLQGALVRHVVRAGGTYVAVGEAPVGPPRLPAPSPGPPIWTSRDAVHWTRVAASPVFPASRALLVNGVAWTGSRFVAVGSDPGGAGPDAWTSPDGRTWATSDLRTAGPGSPTGTEPTAVAVVGSTLLAVGWTAIGDATVPLAWASAEGTHWTSVTLPAYLAGIMLQGVTVSGGGVEVAGVQVDTGDPLPQGTPVQWTLTRVSTRAASQAP